MSYKKIDIPKDTEVMDVPGMLDLTREQHLTHLQNQMVYVDHHDVLRCRYGDFPLATKKEQYEALIEHLERAMNHLD